jgi:hypothetical protein
MEGLLLAWLICCYLPISLRIPSVQILMPFLHEPKVVRSPERRKFARVLHSSHKLAFPPRYTVQSSSRSPCPAKSSTYRYAKPLAIYQSRLTMATQLQAGQVSVHHICVESEIKFLCDNDRLVTKSGSRSGTCCWQSMGWISQA